MSTKPALHVTLALTEKQVDTLRIALSLTHHEHLQSAKAMRDEADATGLPLDETEHDDTLWRAYDFWELYTQLGDHLNAARNNHAAHLSPTKEA